MSHKLLLLSLSVGFSAMASPHQNCSNHCSNGDFYHSAVSYVENGVNHCDYTIERNDALRCPQPVPGNEPSREDRRSPKIPD